ncbi:MAG: SDR family NAD(P)-dependent oxidoreductase [Deltaproteobacteria bacterium]|nr:SDR family NAD(P)-dependent oxidoreductase [Deltaproteobacteria bacterium]
MSEVLANRFNNQVAIVTGGASGIGAAVVSRLAAEGAKVVALDRDTVKLESFKRELSGLGLAIETAVADITDDDAIGSIFNKVAAVHGKVDVLVHSAAVVGPTSTNLLDYPVEAFENTMRINLTGGFVCTKHAIRKMVEKQYGRILLVASIAGKDGNPGMIGYSASKAGLIGFVKAVGKEYATTGITINGLAPAVIETPMNKDCTPAQLEYMLARIPMKRMGTVGEVAATICFAVSREASFTTGFVFDGSGGRTVY